LRAFVDAILSFIGSTSLTDEEFGWITITSQTYTSALYLEIMGVLDARESVSSTRDRLTSYFEAKGVTVTEPSAAQSKIYLGSDLCS